MVGAGAGQGLYLVRQLPHAKVTVESKVDTGARRAEYRTLFCHWCTGHVM